MNAKGGQAEISGQQRLPCKRDNEQPATQEFLAISGEMRPSKKVEDRATQYQGQNPRFLCVSFRERSSLRTGQACDPDTCVCTIAKFLLSGWVRKQGRLEVLPVQFDLEL